MIKSLLILTVGILIGTMAGGLVGYKSAIGAIKAQQPLIEMAIQKNTSEIQNVVQNEFKKIKNKRGESIDINIEPNNDNEMNVEQSQPAKKGARFFNRILRRR